MLRRPPTTLQITAEDVAAYEDRRANEALAAAQQARAEAQAYAQAQQAQTEGARESPGTAARRKRSQELSARGRAVPRTGKMQH
ncbi:Anaphase-promoting complex, subunit CDC26 [Metarhizium rileyi]|uniref:Anaphase-promoting complex, subunit CDC26 n=1 Tax=Metarhizium rileyi (strain RCEF 4871) TaxID=1649241 RepID=A0A167HG66_METRR|nr:Anaphase-promoting complex, subunit CDC26 [Metarhizium rileyi RCEF 4871]